MEKRKKWQLYLIVAVILLTIYNILPTVFFYTKPLKSPIDAKRANVVAEHLTERVNALEPQTQSWLESFCKLLKIKPLSIAISPETSQFANIAFKNVEDANTFREHLPRAGALIPFVPAQLTLYDTQDTASKNVLVQRRIPIHFDTKKLSSYTQFSEKFDAQGHPTPLYRGLIEDRAMQVGLALAGPSENALSVHALSGNLDGQQSQDILLQLAQNILSFTKAFKEDTAVSKRYFSSFTQIETSDRIGLVQNFLTAMDSLKGKIKTEKERLQTESEELKAKGEFLEIVAQQRLELLASREKTLDLASAIVKRNISVFASGHTPLTYATIFAALQKKSILSLEGNNPFIDKLSIDWSNEKIDLSIYPDVEAIRQKLDQSAKEARLRDQVDQLLYNEIALASRQSGEEIAPFQNRFEIHLSSLTSSKSFLALRLSSIASAASENLKETLTTTWHPEHPDLKAASFPIYDYETYLKLPPAQQNFCLVVYAPSLQNKAPPQGFRMNSIYVVAKGMEKILDRLNHEPESEQSRQFMQDFKHLREIFEKSGFVGYRGAAYGISPEYAQDFIFEGEDYYQTVLKATREDFAVHGTKRYAVLEFTDVEQRILTENKIDNRMHEDLLKWRDDYAAAQLNIRGVSKFDVPSPTKSVFLDNFRLSAVKFFRGDDRKILHWGLDLSGGKTVQIELRDTNHRIVTNPDDIRQGINELYNRVNKMGVSEVTIRQEGNYITLDFPGSQNLSAAELIKASTMYFHIVNEKYSSYNTDLAATASRFLQEVWNEAVVTGRKNIDEINAIAWKHLHGDSPDPEVVQPRSEAARILYENGLRLVNPQDTAMTGAFNETFSKVALYRGGDFTDWHGQVHPLLLVFRNYACEGSNLDNVHASYDPSKGNYLSFSIKGSYTGKEGMKISPQNDLYAWTSQFAKEKIAGTPLETYSGGRGWRMAVILNDTVISAPTLDSALRDSAMISGSFTQREINKLEADLKAGSLSFTPHILSEKNVSPELGSKERFSGIFATVISLCLVVLVMVVYYRFGGLVASFALIFNLFLMWATLQNIGATLTLASIAGIILTLGMAVDANVLIFERIREEFAISGRIASAVQAGYRKAFSAILDSNVTTIIAALVLLNFDSGPIKQFAIMLIIGIVSSMFTALFMTRFFFAGWVQNPAHKSLTMMNWFKAKNFNFLKATKKTILISSAVILVGIFALIAQRHSIFGMDFSGGYALNFELQVQKPQGNYRSVVEEALLKAGAKSHDFQIRELSPSNNIRIFLSHNLEQTGRPFFGMPLENDLKEPVYPFETNPKIVWVVNSLERSGLTLTKASLQNLDKNWTQVSGQMSDVMRNHAIIGIVIALFFIFVYITIRFEFKYAISATIGLVHDVIFTVAALGILHWLGVSIQIDLNTVAALLTIIGYSLNDTIIVFDRIREDARLMRKSQLSEIINHALNVTLSRTVLTSGTTVIVLIPMILLGGSTLFGFALVMAIGVIFGTLSSLYVAAPLMKYFHDRQLQKEGRFPLKELT